MPADRDLNHLYEPFRTKFVAALETFNEWLYKHRPGCTAKIIEGFRTAEYQHELYAKGRTAPGKIVTEKDGYKRRSNHQSSLAADVGVFKGKTYVEEPDDETNEYWGHCVRAQGLKWGGDWTSLVDCPHAEWPTDDGNTYMAARRWQMLVGLR